jgi:hypothetical protein
MCHNSLVTLAAASSQLGFFYQTGGQIDWGDATSFAFSEDGRKVLLSESATPLAFSSGILLVSWIIKFRLYKFITSVLAAVEMHARSGWLFCYGYHGCGCCPQRQRMTNL